MKMYMQQHHYYRYFFLLLVPVLFASCSNIKALPDSDPAISKQEATAGNHEQNTSPLTEQNNDGQQPDGQKTTVMATEVQQPEEQQPEAQEAGNQPSDEQPLPFASLAPMNFVKNVKIGWNLGNTMDAGVETLWGNPLTSEKMIQAVKEAGFNTIRIPVTWDKHMGPAPDYTVEKLWMDRVQMIVDYCIYNDMYTIINLHHETWHFPSHDNYEKAQAQLTKLWEQIAKRFEAYDEHLIFEGMNEPRMFGTEYEWNGGNEEGWEIVNLLNADFVEAVRSTGGNNGKRFLMVPTYAASSDLRAWKEFKTPEDPYLIISLHAYTPYDFALNEAGTSTWSIDNRADTTPIDSLMDSIHTSFISKEIPVILGEFGARDKNNLESRSAWAKYYVQKATEKGIPCIWWDNGAFTGSGELFGLFNRRTLTWKHPSIVEALMKGLEAGLQ